MNDEQEMKKNLQRERSGLTVMIVSLCFFAFAGGSFIAHLSNDVYIILASLAYGALFCVGCIIILRLMKKGA